MAESVQVKLPTELSSIITDIKSVRIDRCEPHSNKAIVVDAVKFYHKKVCK